MPRRWTGFGGGDLLLSFDVGLDLAGIGRVEDHDLACFDGVGFSGKVTVPGLPDARDLDAVSCSQNLLSFSLDGPASFAGVAGSDEDVWQWDPLGTNVLCMKMSSVPLRADLIALNEPRDPDQDGLSSFEEVSGVDDPATAWPDTGRALGPAGRLSDPELADSDDDGIRDGEESACGTDPMDPDDALQIVARDARHPEPDGSLVGFRAGAPLYGGVCAGFHIRLQPGGRRRVGGCRGADHLLHLQPAHGARFLPHPP